MLVSNGQHSLLVDGFFTRSGLLASLGGIAPDKNQLKAAVARYNITGLEAIFVSHSHFDHGMDAPALAALTGAEVVGSTSTRCLVAGYDQRQPDPAACSVETRLFHDLGRNKDGEWGNERFEVRLFVTNHGGGRRFLSSTLNRHLGGYIDEPVTPPAKISDYRAGTVYTIWILDRNSGKRFLIQPSAGISNLPDDLQADITFLGVASLAEMSTAEFDLYYQELVKAPGSKWVVPIHWENFYRGAGSPIRPRRNFIDRLDEAKLMLERKAAKNPSVDVIWLTPAERLLLSK